MASGMYRFQRRQYRNYRRRQRRYGIGRSVGMGVQQAPRVFCKMVNVVPVGGTFAFGTNSGFSTNFSAWNMIKLRDPNVATASEPFAAAFVDYSGLYERYLVHGVKVECIFTLAAVNDQDEAFFSCAYAMPPPLDGSAPADPYTVNSLNTAVSFLQEKGIRKQLIGGTNYGQKTLTHDFGYFSIKRLFQDILMDGVDASGEVDATGAAVDDPALQPRIYHKLVSVKHNGLDADIPIEAFYRLTYYVEWFNRRRQLAPVRTEP